MRNKAFVLLVVLISLKIPSVTLSSEYPSDYPCVNQLDAFGGTFTALAISPSNSNILFVGTYLSLYKSIDGGASWHKSDKGIPRFTDITALAISKSIPSTIYSGTASPQNLYKSINSGDTWTEVFAGMTDKGSVSSIAIDPNNPDIVFITLPGGASYTIKGVYKTINGGSSWQTMNSGITDYNVSPIVMDQNNSDVLYLGTGINSAPLYKSTNGGANWSVVNSGLDRAIRGIAVNPQDSNIVYANTISEVYKSFNAGVTWYPLNVSSQIPIRLISTSISIDGNNPETLFLGNSYDWYYKSPDGGSTWIKLGLGLSANDMPSSVVTGGGLSIYSVTWDKLYKSTDNGSTWNLMVNGIKEFGSVYENALQITPTNQNSIFAGSNFGGLLSSFDGGNSWQQKRTQNVQVSIKGVGVQFDPLTVFLGISSIPNIFQIFKSIDGGDTWSPSVTNSGDNIYNVRAIRYDPSNPSIMYAGADGTILKSWDYGSSGS